jgi:hypothetical protein
MRSVLRDRDHLVLHRARTGPPHTGERKEMRDIDISKEKSRHPRDIKVHFDPAEPYSFSPTPSSSSARGVHGLTELFRLVEVQKYSLAIQRLYQFPKEASMWVGVSAAPPPGAGLGAAGEVESRLLVRARRAGASGPPGVRAPRHAPQKRRQQQQQQQ